MCTLGEGILEDGIEIGVVKGIDIGREETKRETARSFLAMGLSVEEVAVGTKLPLETVRALAKELVH